MHLLARSNKRQESSDRFPSSDAPAVLGSSVRSETKMFWLAALAVIGLGMLPSAEAGYSPTYDWPSKPTALVELTKHGKCGKVKTMTGCAVCKAPGQNKNCKKYCEACREDYQKSSCPQTENWNYCSDFLKHYFKCECACFGWKPNCGPPVDHIRCKAIPRGLVPLLAPKAGPEPPEPKPSPPKPPKPPVDPNTVYCIMENLADASATKCSPDTTGPVKLKCKEGSVSCEEALAAATDAAGPAGCYKAGGFNKDGRLDYPFTKCFVQKDDKPVTADDKPATKDDKPATTDAKPATTDAKPATTDDKPATTDAKPATTDDKPAAKDDKPATTDAKPATTDAKPTTTDDKPAAKDDKPATTDAKPATTDAKPATTDAKPATTDDKPATTDAKPATTDAKPATTDDKPAAKDDKPATTDDKPATKDDKPPEEGADY